jgi:transposase
MMYYEIHRMSREGLSVSQISNYLGLNRRTVTRYLSLDEKQYENFLILQSEREKALDAYEGFIKDRLERFRDTSAAQMHDWLKEFDPNFPIINPKTVFNFVCHIRKKYNLPRVKTERQFQMVEELPYGQQAQVDFGEYNMRTVTGGRAKVFFFALVLSRSRYKYVWFTDNHFTSEWAILAHEKAFEYIQGIPDTLVYDQDTILIINENYGDIILTGTFRNYMRDQSFQLHFCRRSDPQSKGKVENVIKYIKQNFLYNRTFHNIETLNDEALGWLGRTANALPHSFTRKEPCKEWLIEQPFLQPYRS